MQVERVVPLARQLLQIPLDEHHNDLWLWEHAERVMRLTQLIASLPEVGGDNADVDALAVAALYHDAAWAVEYRQGRHQRWQLLARPTSDIQREIGAATLFEEVGQLLTGPTARTAVDAIRQCNVRDAKLLEARILGEAEALDEMGTVYVLRQYRQYQAEGRPLEQLVNSWQRQKEYHYWEVRLNDGFRWETTRELARKRLEAVDAFMTAMARDLHGADVARLLKELGVSVAPGPG